MFPWHVLQRYMLFLREQILYLSYKKKTAKTVDSNKYYTEIKRAQRNLSNKAARFFSPPIITYPNIEYQLFMIPLILFLFDHFYEVLN